MPSVWRQDLMANANRTGFKGFVLGWIMNPGFAVATLYRVAHWGYEHGGPLGKIASVVAWRRMVRGYGCYIDPAAIIGPAVRFPHPTGIVIGEGTIIGRDATIYQHVTFGRRNAVDEYYPTIGDGVTFYTGATVIGRTHISSGSVIAAHALVKADVSAHAWKAVGNKT